jgi:serine/threonine protein kinase
VLRFDAFEVDLRARELRKNGVSTGLPEQSIKILAMLLKSPGEVVLREEIRRELWPNDTVVEFDHSINAAMKRLRQALGDSVENPRYIETLARRGYRWKIAVNSLEQFLDVAEVPDASPSNTRSSDGSLIGKKVSHYRVLDILGGGGMGVVYRAEDLKLGRRVALKFLPEELADDTAAMERFEREARAASALNHPNICTIYEVEEHEGQSFIVMELLEGQTLRELIAQGNSQPKTGVKGTPLPLESLLKFALQMADGLEAAHHKGIIHRDIKPVNVFITTQGQIKILDFGLAKLQEPESVDVQPGNKPSAQPTQEWNLRLTLTRTGTTVGTAGYMSPEQLRKEKLDTRTDLFSFGLVLYEMATGQRAFDGETAALLREAILDHTPTPVRQLNPKIPPKLEQVISKALEKDREIRYQTVSELRADLESLRGIVEPKRFRAPLWAMAGVSFVLLTALSDTLWRSKRETPSTLEFKQRQLTINYSENAVVSGAISPDGKELAYSDAKGIHIKLIETGETLTVPQPEELKGVQVNWAIVPTWVRDGTRLIANSNVLGQSPSIWAVPTNSGPPYKLRDGAFAYTISRDGALVGFATSTSRVGFRELWAMTPDGTQARRLLDAGENNAFIGAEWSPNGERIGYVQCNADACSLDSRDVKGGPATTALPSGVWDWTWSPDGRIIYSPQDPGGQGRNCNFWEIRVDPQTGRPLERPKKLTNWAGFCMDCPSVAQDGRRLTYRKWFWQGNIFVADLEAHGTRLSQPKRLTLDEGRNYPATWTADSKSIVFASYLDDQWRILKQTLSQEAGEPITTRAEGNVGGAELSPDGRSVLYIALPNENSKPSPEVRLMRLPLTGGLPQLVLTGSLYGGPHCAWLPATQCVIAERTSDLKQLIFTEFDPSKGRGRELFRFDTDAKADLTVHYVWNLSPDGTRIAVLKYSDSRIRIFRLDGQPWREIRLKSRNSLQSVNWAADGNGFFVSSPTKEGTALLHVDLQSNADVLWEQKGSVAPWNEAFAQWLGGPSAPWAIPSPDGRHLAIYSWSLSANMWMMENF